MKFYGYLLSIFLMVVSINCFSFTAKEKADAIFDVVEQDYSYYFSPKESTSSKQYESGIAYFRLYANQFRSVLWAQQGDLWFSLDGEWHYYGTIDQANQYLCDNRCFSKKTSVKISGTTEFVSQTEKALERLKNYAPDAFRKIHTYIHT